MIHRKKPKPVPSNYYKLGPDSRSQWHLGVSSTSGHAMLCFPTFGGTYVKEDNRHLTLKHATALGLEVDLQATMKARALLGKQRHTTKHVPSIPYQVAPAFYQWLCTQPHQSCFVLRFLMLTAVRTGEVRFATTDEIDGDVLVIPPERTKTKREHKVPLTGEALRVIEQAHMFEGSTLLFPSAKGKPLSDATMSRFMDREGYEARPHGLRATFRSWAEECTDAPFEVKEACLGHVVDIGVVGAYQLSDRLLSRRDLLETWATALVTPTDEA